LFRALFGTVHEICTFKAISAKGDLGDLELEGRFRRKECAAHIIFKLWFQIQVPDLNLHIPERILIA